MANRLYGDRLDDSDLALLMELCIVHDTMGDRDDSSLQALMAHYGSYDRLADLVTGLRGMTRLPKETRKQYLFRCSTSKFSLMVKVAETKVNLSQCMFAGKVEQAFMYTKQLKNLLEWFLKYQTLWFD